MGNGLQARIRGDEEEHCNKRNYQEDSMGENIYRTLLNTEFHKTSAIGPDKTTAISKHQLSLMNMLSRQKSFKVKLDHMEQT